MRPTNLTRREYYELVDLQIKFQNNRLKEDSKEWQRFHALKQQMHVKDHERRTTL
jgi:hypothetical protein